MIIQNNFSNSKWYLKSLPFKFPLDICHIINTQPISIVHNTRPNNEIWNITNDGIFTTKSAYNAFTIQNNNSEIDQSNVRNLPNFTLIWSIQCHPRESLFHWQAYRKILPIKINLIKTKCVPDNTCPLCNNCPETHCHILSDYLIIKPHMDQFKHIFKLL